MRSEDREIFKGVDSLGEIGEFGFIKRLSEAFSPDDKQVFGIGDDCAVLPYSDSQSLLVTTDMLVEGQHFRRNWTPPLDLGYKSLAVNLSDISAMGGKPAFSFLSIAVSKETSVDWLELFFRGKQELAKQYGITIAGGDTTRSPQGLVINHTVLGFVQTEHIKWRSGAETGDRICLTGTIGESGAGLKLLSQQAGETDRRERKNRYKNLITAHNRPRLFIEEAQFLASRSGVHSMIDLSDGVGSDTLHIANRSRRSMHIDLDKLPLTPTFLEACEEFGWSAHELALSAGEDYGLLFTIAGTDVEKVMEEYQTIFNESFTVIGEVSEGPPELKFTHKGNPFQLDKTGYDHFR